MADPEIPEVRAELQGEDAPEAAKRGRSAALFILAVALLMAIAYVLLR